jgi:hypothetical protein
MALCVEYIRGVWCKRPFLVSFPSLFQGLSSLLRRQQRLASVLYLRKLCINTIRLV